MKFSLSSISILSIILLFCSCKTAQIPYTISDGSTFETKSFYPKFSWETTPMYYMFGDPKRVLHPEEVEFIAERTDFICIEKSHGHGDLGAAELGAKHEVAAFKKAKPDMKVLFYFNSAYAWPFTSFNENFTKENINNYPELKAFLIENPETKALEERKNVFYFDVLNPDFQEWWVNTVAEAVEFSGADGAFIDQMHGFAWLRQDKAQDVQKAMGTMMKALKEKLGPDKILLGNNANAKLARYVFPSIDANMFEHYGDKMLTKEKLLTDWEDMLKISKAGKMSIFRIGVEYDSVAIANPSYYKGKKRNERYAKLSKEKLEYYHACYLIGAQPYSYFQYGWGWQLAHGSLMEYPELQKPLGTPKGAYHRTSTTGWEFTREYEHASVWVNTKTREAKITWH